MFELGDKVSAKTTKQRNDGSLKERKWKLTIVEKKVLWGKVFYRCKGTNYLFSEEDLCLEK